MSRRRTGGRSGARTSTIGATESSSAVPVPDRERTPRASASKRPERERPDRGRSGPAVAPAGLIVTATPIGNLGDITVRALETLERVDVIACEDTRVTRRLLDRYGIGAPTLTYHEHNAERVRPRLVARLTDGDSVALVADAGTPLISDPGFKLVRAAIDAGVPVTTLPGPTAMAAALAVGGLPTNRFMFAGFLPNRPAARRRELEGLRDVDATLVFYESPRRLAAALADMADVLGPREAAVARELTKRHEDVARGPLGDLARRAAEAPPPRGEIAVVVGPPAEREVGDRALDDALRRALARSGPRDAVDRVAADTGASRRRVYRRALELRKRLPGTSDADGA